MKNSTRAGLIAAFCGLLGAFIAMQYGDKTPAVAHSVQTEIVPTPTVVPETDNYKLVVGAKPSMNNSQKFLPPTNSVVVTNEAQLQLLMEQTRQTRQQQQQTQTVQR